METAKVELKLSGSVKPPADMVKAARKTLGPRYTEFVKQYPGEITPAKLCKFLGE